MVEAPDAFPELSGKLQPRADFLSQSLLRRFVGRCGAIEFAQGRKEIVIQRREKAVLARCEQEPARRTLAANLADVIASSLRSSRL